MENWFNHTLNWNHISIATSYRLWEWQLWRLRLITLLIWLLNIVPINLIFNYYNCLCFEHQRTLWEVFSSSIRIQSPDKKNIWVNCAYSDIPRDWHKKRNPGVLKLNMAVAVNPSSLTFQQLIPLCWSQLCSMTTKPLFLLRDFSRLWTKTLAHLFMDLNAKSTFSCKLEKGR